MPIYEYDCPECGVVEVMQGITDKPLKKCPNCKSKVTKLISLSSFQLKGSGWYVTDYGKGNGNGNGRKKDNDLKESTSKEPTTKESTSKETSSTESKKPEKAQKSNTSQA